MRDERPEILDADMIPYAGPPPDAGRAGRDKRIWQALRAFREKYEVGAEPVVVGIPGEHFFLRPFNVFVVGERTEQDLVRYELDQHMPFGLDAVLWDYETFPAEGPSDREVDGLIFAMKKEVFNDYLLCLAAGDIDPDEMQAAPLGLYNYLQHEFDPIEPTLVIDVGAANTTVLALYGLRYTLRTVRTGADAITKTLHTMLGRAEATHGEIEAIQLNLPQLSDRAEVAELLSKSLRVFVREICDSVLHVTDASQTEFKKAVLLGGGAHTYGLARMISEELDMPAVTPAGLANIDISARVDKDYVNRNLPSLCTAIGLALQGVGIGATDVNVIGSTLVRRRSQTMTRRVAVMATVGLFLLSLFWGTAATLRTYRLQTATTNLHAQIMPLRQRTNALEAIRHKVARIRARADRFRRMAVERRVWAATVDKVASILPDNQRAALPDSRRVWLLNLKLSSPTHAGEPYRGVLETGNLLRSDASHTLYADTTVLVPLREDPTGAFRIAREPGGDGEYIRDIQAPVLDFHFDVANRDYKYYLRRIHFEVVPENIPEPRTIAD
jgi:type IV pilus assembly protein PilM